MSRCLGLGVEVGRREVSSSEKAGHLAFYSRGVESWKLDLVMLVCCRKYAALTSLDLVRIGLLHQFTTPAVIGTIDTD